MKTASATSAPLGVVHPHAAGLDIGKHEIWAAVPPSPDRDGVRAFGTFPPDLQALADWLATCGITTAWPGWYFSNGWAFN